YIGMIIAMKSKNRTDNTETYLQNYYNKNNSTSNYYYSNPSYSNSSYSNSSYYSSSNYSFSGTGNIVVYTNCSTGGTIDVYVDGDYKGTLQKYFKLGHPSAAWEDGTVSIEVDGGFHTIEAIDSEGTYWGSFRAVYSDYNNF